MMLLDYLLALPGFPPTLPLGHRTANEVYSFYQGRHPPTLPRPTSVDLCICVTSEGLICVLEVITFLTFAILLRSLATIAIHSSTALH